MQDIDKDITKPEGRSYLNVASVIRPGLLDIYPLYHSIV